VSGQPADPDRVQWLETLVAACERILAREEREPADWSYRQVRQDVEGLLACVKAELEGKR